MTLARGCWGRVPFATGCGFFAVLGQGGMRPALPDVRNDCMPVAAVIGRIERRL